MNYSSIIKKAVVTEKSNVLMESLGRYVFEVDKKATKGQILKAIEDLYSVKVEQVNVLANRSKLKQSYANRKRVNFYTKEVKKAVVKLSKDQVINLFDSDTK